MKINRHDQAKILSAQEIAWLFDGKRVWFQVRSCFGCWFGLEKGKGWRRKLRCCQRRSPPCRYSLITEGLPTDRDRALFGICFYTTARVNEACSLHTTDVYGVNGRVRDRITFRRATTKGKQEM